MRLILSLALLLPAAAVAQQARPLSVADSTLVGRVLLAEDRRDSTDAALARALQHPDARLRTLARRAIARIRDPKFVSRDSLPALPPPRTWPEPSWRLRYRALAPRRADCAVLGAALGDSVWHVRLRAADLLQAPCASDEGIVRTLRAWVDSMPADVNRRRTGEVSWHAAAHAVVALARLRPDEARSRIQALSSHPRWQLRLYATRAAGVLADTARLRAAARDSNDNVKEAAVDALSRLVGHAADDVYLQVLRARGAQAVRAAAVALKGSPRTDVPRVASVIFDRWVLRANASERDARVALLEAARRAPSDDRPPKTPVLLPADAVPLALGREVRVRVTMSPASGGGSFVVRMRGDVAPIMSGRILTLVRRRHYDGGTWHRVEPDFVIQGGAHGDNEYVGLAQFLRDELGTVPHVRGTVGMSTRGHDTGDAQWFINLRNNLRLASDYTVFAEVAEGIEVVDGVMEGDVVERMEVVQ